MPVFIECYRVNFIKKVNIAFFYRAVFPSDGFLLLPVDTSMKTCTHPLYTEMVKGTLRKVEASKCTYVKKMRYF
jgi:hypothetical protein